MPPPNIVQDLLGRVGNQRLGDGLSTQLLQLGTELDADSYKATASSSVCDNAGPARNCNLEQLHALDSLSHGYLTDADSTFDRAAGSRQHDLRVLE